MVNVFCEESPFLLPSALDNLRGIVHRIATPMVRRVIDRSPAPGRSLAPLPETSLPEDMGWAALNETIARAFAGFAAITDDLANDQFSADVLDPVREQIMEWNGEDPGFGNDWIEEPTAALKDSARPVAQLALLTALASYRVDETHIERFRIQYPGDVPLIILTSWSALTSTRKIGTWLQFPPE